MNNQRSLTLTNGTYNGAAYHQNNMTQINVTRDTPTSLSEGPPLTPPIITHTDATPQGSPHFTGEQNGLIQTSLPCHGHDINDMAYCFAATVQWEQ